MLNRIFITAQPVPQIGYLG